MERHLGKPQRGIGRRPRPFTELIARLESVSVNRPPIPRLRLAGAQRVEPHLGREMSATGCCGGLVAKKWPSCKIENETHGWAVRGSSAPGRASLLFPFPRNSRDEIFLRELGDSGETQAWATSGQKNILALLIDQLADTDLHSECLSTVITHWLTGFPPPPPPVKGSPRKGTRSPGSPRSGASSLVRR